MRRILSLIAVIWMTLTSLWGQINTDRVLAIGRNALYFEDYVLSIQYFNEVIAVRPFLAEPYLYRSIAKVYLDDYLGAMQDASACIERNPFIVTAWQVRGIARQNLKDYDGAISDFMEGLQMQPENKVFLRDLGVSYALKQDYSRADSCFQNFMSLFPNEPAAYMTRAQLKIEMGDSLQALELLNKAISLDKSSAYSYALRSMLFEQQSDHAAALEDMNKAIRLDPEQPSFYINRALIYYNQENLSNALADYDLALELSPENMTALYNRGLLRAQVGDRNRAISDFSAVIGQDPSNTFAYYNRAILRDETGDLNGAVEDYTCVYEQHPNYFPVLYARSEAYRKMGKTSKSDEDYRLAFAVENRVKSEHEARERKIRQMQAQGIQNPDSVLLAQEEVVEDDVLTDEERTRQESEKNIRKFNKLVASNVGNKDQRYSSELRGRVQDKNGSVEMQPMFVLSYYEKIDETSLQGSYFEKNLSDFNRAGLLSRRLKVVCHEPMLSQAQVQAHFSSIDEYSRLIGLSGGSIINYFGRSLDFQLVQDYQSAIEDLNQVLIRKDNFILAYFNRAIMRFRQLEIDEKTGWASVRGNVDDDELRNTALLAVGSQQGVSNANGSTVNIKINNSGLSGQERARIEAERAQRIRKVECDMVMRDLDKVIELAPQFVYAYYNRAFISAKLNNFDSALEDLDEAIRIYPNFAEAYYNRGLILLRIGKTKAGMQDLSKAGELGLAQAYSVLKRAISD